MRRGLREECDGGGCRMSVNWQKAIKKKVFYYKEEIF